MLNKPWKKDLETALAVLRAGGVVLYPTDTIWGLGCDPQNEAAVNRIYALKNRPPEKRMLLLSDGVDTFLPYVGDVPQAALEAIRHATQPLTVIYENARNLAPGVATDAGTVGIRVVKDEFCRNLIAAFGKPIVSTSANLSGQVFKGYYSDVPEEIRENVDFTVHWRQEEETEATASRIVRIDKAGAVEVIRG